MEGLLLIDKPTGLTSHQVIDIIRQKLNIKKVGHAGTLDPLATGLLVIMVGKTTKLSNLLINQFKSYEVEMKLFVETDTGDITGKVIIEQTHQNIEKTQIEKVISSFNNFTYQQKIPLYSAVKIQGKKLYEYARQGIEIATPTRQITIKKITFLDYNLENNTIKFEAECSKGTYIRSLVKDIAEKLGTVATVSQLKRVSSGNFYLCQAISLEKVSPKKLIPQSELFAYI